LLLKRGGFSYFTNNKLDGFLKSIEAITYPKKIIPTHKRIIGNNIEIKK